MKFSILSHPFLALRTLKQHRRECRVARQMNVAPPSLEQTSLIVLLEYAADQAAKAIEQLKSRSRPES